MREHICPCSCLCFCVGVDQKPDLGCMTPCTASVLAEASASQRFRPGGEH